MLVHRFSLDRLADAIRPQIFEAAPESRLARRFYRNGLRDGRRHRPTSSKMAFVQNAVELAMSKIAEEYLTEDLELKVRSRRLSAELAECESVVSNSPPPSDNGGQSHPDASAARLLAVRQQRSVAAALAERQRLIGQAASLRQQIAELSERSARLFDVTKQRLDSCRQTGQFLWSRYLTGFDVGRAKRGAPDDDAPGHSTVMEFVLPESFATSAVGRE